MGKDLMKSVLPLSLLIGFVQSVPWGWLSPWPSKPGGYDPFGFNEAKLRAGWKIPEAIDVQYDQVYNNALKVDLETVRQSVHEDYQRFPNEINPGLVGPGAEGLRQTLSGFGGVFSDFMVSRRHTMTCTSQEQGDDGEYIIVVGSFQAQLRDDYKDAEFPMFPGVDAERIKGKGFTIQINDLHLIEEGKIKTTWHAEDWSSALEQMLTGKGEPLLEFPEEETYETLTDIPQAMTDFYTEFLSNAGSEIKGSRLDLLEQTMNQDWELRPNNLNPRGSGPGQEGFIKIAGILGTFMQDLKFQRRKWLICGGDKVLALNKVSGKAANPAGGDEIPVFPGVPAEKLVGKEFETFAIDLHQFKNGMLKNVYHIEDFSNTAVRSMIDGTSPFALERKALNKVPGETLTDPKAEGLMASFYDDIVNDASGIGQDPRVLKQVLHDDYNSRPSQTPGPYQQGFQQFMGLWSQLLPSAKVERQETLLNCFEENESIRGQWAVVRSKLAGVVNTLPEYLKGRNPLFPGIPQDKVKGKRFEINAHDIHIVHEGKIRRSWHIEDWASALDQALNANPPPSLDNPSINIETGPPLKKVPASVIGLYDVIFQDLQQGSNETLLEQIFTENWSSRPNVLNPVEGDGPYREGAKKLFSFFDLMIPGAKLSRKKTLICGNQVVVLSDMYGTVNPPSDWEGDIPFFPGIDSRKIVGKSFSTLALDIHTIDKQGKIAKSHHIEDYLTAIKQILGGPNEPEWDLGLDRDFSNTNILSRVPDNIKSFYDVVLTNPEVASDDLKLLKTSLHDDWETRVNPINPVEGTGPYPEGLQGILKLWGATMEDILVERKQNVLNCQAPTDLGNFVTVVSRFAGTIKGAPPGFDEIPFFPGIQVEDTVGKRFETLAMDIQVVLDGKTKRTWHMEDWGGAVAHLLRGGSPAPGMVIDNPDLEPGETLTEVPDSIINFYDSMLSDPGAASKNLTFLRENFHDDWNSRPNALDPVNGDPGPFVTGLQTLLGGFAASIPDIKFERMLTLPCGDQVTVLSRMTGTMGDTPPGLDFYPVFPGIDASKVKGKRFTSYALDLHNIRGGKIKSTWHMEDWAVALDQMLNNKPVPDFGFAQTRSLPPEFLYLKPLKSEL